MYSTCWHVPAIMMNGDVTVSVVLHSAAVAQGAWAALHWLPAQDFQTALGAFASRTGVADKQLALRSWYHALLCCGGLLKGCANCTTGEAVRGALTADQTSLKGGPAAARRAAPRAKGRGGRGAQPGRQSKRCSGGDLSVCLSVCRPAHSQPLRPSLPPSGPFSATVRPAGRLFIRVRLFVHLRGEA
jgi:hypothetical protein